MDDAMTTPRYRIWGTVVVGFVAIVGLALWLVSTRLDFLRASYELASEERNAERLLEERRHLILSRASLRSPSRLALEAMTRSTLHRPDAEQWLRWPSLGRTERWPW